MLAGNKLLTAQPLIDPSRTCRLSSRRSSARCSLPPDATPALFPWKVLTYPSRLSTRLPLLKVPFLCVCSGSPLPPCHTSAPVPCTLSHRSFSGTKDMFQNKQLVSRARMRGEIP